MSLLAASWDASAEVYERYWVPRFRPWIIDTVRRLGPLPPGPIAVPCCGTGAELRTLAARYPDREIIGFDLSPGMVAVAQASAAGVRIEVADASVLPGRWAGVVSCFGLQQLPDPPAALTAWCQALLPGGRLSVALWTDAIQDRGPFDALRVLSDRHLGPSERTWSARLRPAVEAAAVLLSDDLVPHPIHHDSPTAFWAGLVDGGLWQSRIRRHPEETEAIRREFLARWPEAPITHTPHARILTAAAL